VDLALTLERYLDNLNQVLKRIVKPVKMQGFERLETYLRQEKKINEFSFNGKGTRQAESRC
jgi:hypothetical protein